MFDDLCPHCISVQCFICIFGLNIAVWAVEGGAKVSEHPVYYIYIYMRYCNLYFDWKNTK